jgi:hypothetical protein
MYSGGDGYYWLLRQINQQASYFALSNRDWQLLAMDTGHNDCNPITVASNMTSLNPNEVDWVLSKINSAERRKTILLSHHQLFSAFGSAEPVQKLLQLYAPGGIASGMASGIAMSAGSSAAAPNRSLRTATLTFCAAKPLGTIAQSEALI